MDQKRAGDTLPKIINDLFSYEEGRYKEVLDTYFTENAKLSHPLLNVEGTHNIRKVFRVWTSLNCKEPEVPHVPVFDGEIAVIQVTQHLCPRILPFIDIKVPSITILTFCKNEEDGLYYIKEQKDNWTLEGLIQSVPLINWWYDCVVRVVVGDLVSRAGSFLATANQATSNLTVKANEIRDNGQSAIAQGQNTAKEYFHPIQTYITNGYSKGQEFVDSAKNSVKNQISKISGYQSNGNISPEMMPIPTAH